MASTIKVDTIRGSTADTITIPTGQTLTVTDGVTLGSLPTVTVAKGGTNLTSFTAGDVLYATGSTTLAKLAKGTALQALAMNAGATAPEWAGIAGVQTIWVPAQAMFGTTTNGADAQAVETTATRPELKVLDFDASTAEYAQFSVAMPKSWNLGTVTYQVFWSPGSTNTGNCIFGLQGLACTEGDTADAVFGTAVEVTDAGIATIEDVQMTAVSGAVTIGGTPADDDITFFQLYRDAADGSDTFTGDARVLGIKLFYTTDALNDAQEK